MVVKPAAEPFVPFAFAPVEEGEQMSLQIQVAKQRRGNTLIIEACSETWICPVWVLLGT